MIFIKKVRNDPDISFNSMDLILEGLMREVGAIFRKKFNVDKVNELNIRKFLLRGLYGSSFKALQREYGRIQDTLKIPSIVILPVKMRRLHGTEKK